MNSYKSKNLKGEKTFLIANVELGTYLEVSGQVRLRYGLKLKQIFQVRLVKINKK